MSKHDIELNRNGEHTICIDTEQTIETQNKEEEEEKKANVENVLDLQNVKVENNKGSLIYGKPSFPIKKPSLWVQYIGRNRRGIQPTEENPNANPPHQNFSPYGGGGGGGGFDYDPDRNDFVKFVFTLVLIMILFTAAITFFCYRMPACHRMFGSRTGYYYVLLACGVILGISYAFACSGCVRSAPCSYFCLFLTALMYGVICSYFAVKYETKGFFLAAIATSFVVIVCLILACTSFDFTRFILYIIVIGAAFSFAVLVYFMFTLITREHFKPLHIAILVIGTVLNAVMLVIELQMILGGRSVELSEEDYAYGAFSVYTSVLSMFINILQLLNMDEYLLGFISDNNTLQNNI